MDRQTLGFIGLGRMGLPMARNLIGAGYDLIGYDIRPEAIDALVESGGQGAAGAAEVCRDAKVVHVCLVGHVDKQVFADQILPNLQEGQILIDHSTVPVGVTRDMAARCADKGVEFLDAPISGGIGGAQKGTLRIFVGGNEKVFQRVRPLLLAMGAEKKRIYAGEAGRGQAVKVVQQLTHRLIRAARMEVVAFGRREGLDWDLICRALDVDPDGDDPYAHLIAQVRGDRIPEPSVLFGEWAYYLAEAGRQGIPMPMLEGLYRFCRDADKPIIDGQGRRGPDLWKELMSRRGAALD